MVAAGAVVRGTVPDHAGVAGAPARVVSALDARGGLAAAAADARPGADPGRHDAGRLRALADLDEEAVARLGPR